MCRYLYSINTPTPYKYEKFVGNNNDFVQGDLPKDSTMPFLLITDVLFDNINSKFNLDGTRINSQRQQTAPSPYNIGGKNFSRKRKIKRKKNNSNRRHKRFSTKR